MASPSLRPLNLTRSISKSAITTHLPRIAQPSLWRNLIPRSLRQDPNAPPRPRGMIGNFLANPASGVIILAMLTGNASVHLIQIKREMKAYTRMADRKIAVLREVIRRVQNGEVFDVEKALGTGNAKKEAEWAEAIREIEKDESIVGRAERQRLRREGRKQDELEGNTEVQEARGESKGPQEAASTSEPVQTTRRPSFL